MKIKVDIDDIYSFADEVRGLKFKMKLDVNNLSFLNLESKKRLSKKKSGYYLNDKYIAKHSKTAIEKLAKKWFLPSGNWDRIQNKLKKTIK